MNSECHSQTKRRMRPSPWLVVVVVACFGVLMTHERTTTTASAAAAAFVPSAPLLQRSGRITSTTTTTTTTTQLDLRRLTRPAKKLFGGWTTLRSPASLVASGKQNKNSNRATGVAPPRSSNEEDPHDNNNNNSSSSSSSRQRRMRQRIRELAKNVVWKPIQTATTIAPMPQAIATVLKDATLNAVDMAVDEGELVTATDR